MTANTFNDAFGILAGLTDKVASIEEMNEAMQAAVCDAYDALKRDPDRAISADEVRRRLAERRAARSQDADDEVGGKIE